MSNLLITITPPGADSADLVGDVRMIPGREMVETEKEVRPAKQVAKVSRDWMEVIVLLTSILLNFQRVVLLH